ncbi:MAG: iron-containing alcohol dehydrogenase [Kiritimatiellae bacterium]|jgi:alcohol dehydrogenase YqhD (iron-dependent ADH family)|nr:iron-containing alcohol dehydrogenase [Kiritimatiellia bacterium]
MYPFEYCNPTKIIFGEDTVKTAGEHVSSCGLKNILLVYGKASIKKNGVYDVVTASLKEAGVEWTEWSGVSPNPLRSHTQAGIELAKEKGVDGILAVGGGSVIDEAKAIALGVPAECDFWDYYVNRATITPEKALPLCTVLTLPATGTEMNGGTVITDDESREKRAVISPVLNPKISILDPKTTISVPPNYVAYSASDAISHTIESYLTRADGFMPVQDGYAEGVVKAIMRSTERILEDPFDLEARASMMWAATLAWNFLGSSGVGAWTTPSHTLEHPMSGLFDVAHGAGLAVTGPAWMTWESRRRSSRIASFARNIMDVTESDDAKACKEGIEQFRAWLSKIGNPVSLRECNIQRDQIPELARHSEILAKAWGTGDEYTADVIAEILELGY